MRGFAVDIERLSGASDAVGDLVAEPRLWSNVLQQISEAAGATGAALLRSDVRTPDSPRTASVDANVRSYYASGWHRRDTLSERGFPLFANGHTVISEQDIVTAEEMKRLAFYNDFLLPFDLQWFAGIGFWAGPALWAMLILRSPRQGAFEAAEKLALSRLSQKLSETATLSTAVGRIALSGAVRALHLVNRPALALDRFSRVLDINAGMSRIFDDDVYVRDRHLTVKDRRAAARLDTLADRLRTTPDTDPLPEAPLIVHRQAKPPLIVRILPIGGAARTPFLGARALLTFTSVEQKAAPDPDLLADAFGLTRAEADVASFLVQGKSAEAIAARRGIAPVTVRNQIKALLAKTGTHRQSELIALLSRL